MEEQEQKQEQQVFTGELTETYPKGACVIIEGERNDGRFFIIREGKVRLSREIQVVDGEPGKVLEPGDLLGVVSTMAGRRSHIETARALTDVALTPVRQDQFSQLIKADAPLALKVILSFSKRMRYLNEALAKITLNKNDGGIDAEHLFAVAGYYDKNRHYGPACYAYHQYIKHCPNGKSAGAARERLREIMVHAETSAMSFKTDGRLNRTYPKGAMIFLEGEPGEEAFVIKSGSVRIVKVAEGGEILLAILKTGDIFGEMALLDSDHRVASAIAHEECEVMALNRANFNQMIRTQPQIIARLTTLLAERIWLLYKQLANTLIADPAGRMYDMLLVNLEKRQVELDSPQAFLLDFGVKELVGMVGLPLGNIGALQEKLLQNRHVEIVQNKIRVRNVLEFVLQVNYYRKMMQKNEKFRRAHL